MVRVPKHGDRCSALLLVDFIRSAISTLKIENSFDLNNLSWYIRSLAEFKDGTTKNSSKPTMNNGGNITSSTLGPVN